MPLWQIITTLGVSGLVFWWSRHALLQVPSLMKMAEEEEDSDQALRLVTLGCLGAVGVMPILVVSGLLFVLSLAALTLGPWE